MNKALQFIKVRGVWCFAMAVVLSSLFLGPLSFLSSLYQPAILVCLICLCTKLNKANVGWAELLLIMTCGLSIILGDPLPIFNSWMRLGLFCIVLFVTTPIVSSPSIDKFRVRLFNWISLICVFAGAGSFIAYFLGINYMRSYSGAYSTHLGGSFGGLTMQSMLLGPLAALGMLRCVYIAIQKYEQEAKSSYFLYCSAFACFLSVLMASSRGAAGAALIATCYMTYSLLKRKMGKLIKIVLFLSCLSVPLAPVVGYFSSGLVAKQEANMESGGTFNSREYIWEARLEEWKDSPVYGVGFSAQRIITHEATLRTGQVEPGTSYGAVFAMTGTLGGALFLFILGSACVSKKGFSPSMPQVYLVFFVFHMFTEGYVYAGGSPLCFIFWLCIGAACATKRLPQLQNIIA